MNQYILDYSNPGRAKRRSGRNFRARLRMYRVYRRMLMLLSGLICGISLLSLAHQRTETQLIQQRYDAQLIQYDSLLAAKLEVDQQLARVYRRLSLEPRTDRVRYAPRQD